MSNLWPDAWPEAHELCHIVMSCKGNQLVVFEELRQWI